MDEIQVAVFRWPGPEAHPTPGKKDRVCRTVSLPNVQLGQIGQYRHIARSQPLGPHQHRGFASS